MTADALTPRERLVFLAGCTQADADGGTGKPQVLWDPEYRAECDRLTGLGLFERVEHEFAGGRRELAGYRLSEDAALIHQVQNEIEQAGVDELMPNDRREKHGGCVPSHPAPSAALRWTPGPWPSDIAVPA
jgi:hypothetical protein